RPPPPALPDQSGGAPLAAPLGVGAGRSARVAQPPSTDQRRYRRKLLGPELRRPSLGGQHPRNLGPPGSRRRRDVVAEGGKRGKARRRGTPPGATRRYR